MSQVNLRAEAIHTTVVLITGPDTSSAGLAKSRDLNYEYFPSRREIQGFPGNYLRYFPLSHSCKFTFLVYQNCFKASIASHLNMLKIVVKML